jgi:adenylate cyclase
LCNRDTVYEILGAVTPAADDIRAQLDRILASAVFANSGRLSQLLKYVGERTLAGEGDQLKEYVVGVEVFERGSNYDPRLDSIVRVEARRLRAKLEEYYRGDGANDPITIEIPRGSYVPMFRASQPVGNATFANAKPETSIDQNAEVPETATAPAEWWGRRQLIVVGLGAAAIILVSLAGWQPSPGTPAAPRASSAIRVAVLPFAHFSTDPEIAMLAARITDGVTTELARLGTLSVVSRTSAAQFISEERPVTEVAQILDADLVMEGSAIVEDGRVKVVARLIHGVIDRKVWVGEYDSSPQEIDELQRRIAAEAGPAASRVPDLPPR